MSDDPFASLKPTGEPADTPEATDDATAAFDFFEMEIGEQEFEQPQERRAYVLPPDGAWVPVEIVSGKIGTWDMNILPPGEDKEPVSTPVPRFELECQHASTAYGDKPWPYNLRVPAFDIRFPSKRGPWIKDSGRRLIAATRAATPGTRVNRDTLEQIVEAMVGKVILVQIRHVTKDYTDSEYKVGDDGQFVKAKVDDEGAFVEVERDAEGIFRLKSTGVALPDGLQDAKLYIENNGTFLIPDADGTPVREVVTTTKTFDNLQDNVAPVPARDISYTKADGKSAKGEITLETVGAIATRPIKHNTKVSALTKGGELVRLSWTGASWAEAEGDAFDAFKGDAI
jgi:hypothetical protein